MHQPTGRMIVAIQFFNDHQREMWVPVQYYSVDHVIFSLIVQVLFLWDIGDKWEKGCWGPEMHESN